MIGSMAALLLNFSLLILICFFVSFLSLTSGIEILIVLSLIIVSLVPLYPLSHIASVITLSPTFDTALLRTKFNVFVSWILYLCADTPTIIPDFLVVTILALVPNSYPLWSLPLLIA